jgi:F0F1-type ATP synthase, beta subunit
MAIEWRTVPRGQSLGLLESTLKSKNRLGAVLAGSAGVGKTVLARHAVDRFAQRHGGVSVQWLVGTASARQIPFGAFSHLVDVAGVGDSPTLLRSARASLLQHGGRGLLLAIDDAHHLDNLSATLVHQLALTGSARFVITVRAGEQAPDAITSLWKDRLLDRLDIEPFDAAQTKSLLEAVLGGHGDLERRCGIYREPGKSAVFASPDGKRDCVGRITSSRRHLAIARPYRTVGRAFGIDWQAPRGAAPGCDVGHGVPRGGGTAQPCGI